ncbi:CPBP family intramembrane metalloprotease [Brevibacterium luteolum]|uniref:CPBP family intramembrane metalloprotease n=1 Tax=Brevibacterium luteolum TaxID=199591 RepID=A0A6G8KUB8_9MICO|nr:CPBP family intramembrane metalloprotease [Brevibacterium luteolum]
MADDNGSRAARGIGCRDADRAVRAAADRAGRHRRLRAQRGARLGEELGWRGYLTAALRRRGLRTVAMIVVSGAIWGAWHAPVLLLGHNFETRSPISIPIMMIGCICVGAVFVWLRETSGSIWPAAIGHGSFNAAAGISILVAAGGTWSDPIIANPLGVSGWIVIGLGALGLFLSTRRQSRHGAFETRSAA